MGRPDLCMVETWNQCFPHSDKSGIPYNSEESSSLVTAKEGKGREKGKGREG